MKKKPKAVKPVTGWAVVYNEDGRVSEGGAGWIVWKRHADAVRDMEGSTECRVDRVQITLAKQPHKGE